MGPLEEAGRRVHRRLPLRVGMVLQEPDALVGDGAGGTCGLRFGRHVGGEWRDCPGSIARAAHALVSLQNRDVVELEICFEIFQLVG